MPLAISKPRVIVCEGGGDVAFFKALIQARHLPDFEVFEPNRISGLGSGKDSFGRFLLALPVQSGFAGVRGVLIVGDNDSDPAAAFQNIQDQVQGAGGFGVPANALQVARSASRPPIVVMMLPWTAIPGTLETLCLNAIYAQYPHLRHCVDAYCTCAGTAAWNVSSQSKMRMQSLMPAICQSNPDVPLSGAWSQNETIVPLNHNSFDQVAQFLSDFDDLIA